MAATKRKPGTLDPLVVSLLTDAGRALSSYELIDDLTAMGERVLPTQVHRALDRLVASGAIRRIETLRRYALPAAIPDQLVATCARCGTFADARGDDIALALRAHAQAQGFAVRRVIAEAMAECAVCGSRGDDAP